METCGATTDENCDGKDCAVWAQVFGDEEEQSPLDVGVAADGSVYVLGVFKGTLDFGAEALVAGGGEDLFLVKLDGTGKYMWSKQFSNPGWQASASAAGLRADLDVREDGEVVVAGSFLNATDFGKGTLMSQGYTDVYVVRITSGGEVLWSKSFGWLEEETLAGVGFTADDAIFLSGQFQFEANFGDGQWQGDGTSDGFLLKLSAATGELLRALQIGGLGDTDSNQRVDMQAIDPAGSVTILGPFASNIKICGKTYLPADGQWFAARFDGATGACEWSETFNGPARFTHGRVDAVGEAIFGGTLRDGVFEYGPGSIAGSGSSSAPDVFLFKIGVADGAFKWGASIHSPDVSDALWGLAVDSNERIFLGIESAATLELGGMPLSPAGANDLFLAKLAADKTHLWSRQFGDAAEQRKPCLAVFPTGDILLAAEVSGQIDLGAGLIPTKGTDLLVARLAP